MVNGEVVHAALIEVFYVAIRVTVCSFGAKKVLNSAESHPPGAGALRAEYYDAKSCVI